MDAQSTRARRPPYRVNCKMDEQACERSPRRHLRPRYFPFLNLILCNCDFLRPARVRGFVSCNTFFRHSRLRSMRRRSSTPACGSRLRLGARAHHLPIWHLHADFGLYPRLPTRALRTIRDYGDRWREGGQHGRAHPIENLCKAAINAQCEGAFSTTPCLRPHHAPAPGGRGRQPLVSMALCLEHVDRHGGRLGRWLGRRVGGG